MELRLWLTPLEMTRRDGGSDEILGGGEEQKVVVRSLF